MTLLVLPSGRRVSVRLSAREIRERFRRQGYIMVGTARIRPEQVAMICVDDEVVEEKKRRILSPLLARPRRRRTPPSSG